MHVSAILQLFNSRLKLFRPFEIANSYLEIHTIPSHCLKPRSPLITSCWQSCRRSLCLLGCVGWGGTRLHDQMLCILVLMALLSHLIL